jgi:hypothetical protein
VRVEEKTPGTLTFHRALLLPDGSPLPPVPDEALFQGLGIPVRSEVAAGADAWDLLNDSFTRMVLPDEVPSVDAP